MEANPNPNSLKFVADRMLLQAGDSLDFPDKEAAQASPLATKLFELPYVERVFFMSNFVTVTKNEQTEWGEVQQEVKLLIQNYLESGEPLITKPVTTAQRIPTENDTDAERKIKEVLDEYIRPAVEGDGGAIQFHSFENGVVKVLLQGACSGCPSSTITLKAGIERLLKHEVPGVESVEAEGV
jgi:Fe-S cluster biogenesis protein NfuA